MTRIAIYDTAPRDGTQGEEVARGPEVELASRTT